jgi:starvation-inducible DNA-binding protein
MPTTTKTQTSSRTNGKTVVKKSFPAPRELATVTDLAPRDVQAITQAVNPIVADSIAMYIKAKNFHWHLSGPRFRDLHLLFDEIAEAAFASIDPLAERIRKIGGCTLRSVTHVTQLQTIHDDNEEFISAREMLQRLMDDLNQIAESQRSAVETCEEHRDSVTAHILQDLLDQTERYKWFLFEALQGKE